MLCPGSLWASLIPAVQRSLWYSGFLLFVSFPTSLCKGDSCHWGCEIRAKPSGSMETLRVENTLVGSARPVWLGGRHMGTQVCNAGYSCSALIFQEAVLCPEGFRALPPQMPKPGVHTFLMGSRGLLSVAPRRGDSGRGDKGRSSSVTRSKFPHPGESSKWILDPAFLITAPCGPSVDPLPASSTKVLRVTSIAIGIGLSQTLRNSYCLETTSYCRGPLLCFRL